MEFEDFEPVCGISSYEGQQHLTGVYCFRGQHVAYRSVLHREVLRILDFDAEVLGVRIFPFYVHAEPGSAGRAPDFLLKLPDGRLRVVDVRRAAVANAGTTQAELRPTREACESLGWEYRLITEPDALVLKNIEWLSLYRREPLDYETYREHLLVACTAGASIDELVADADIPALLQPVLFHMLWKRELRMPLEAPMRGSTSISVDTRIARGRD